MWLIFSQFFLLGCISFGGPAAHIGYFRNTFVEKLTWLTEKEYADLVALSQFLPGPGSSQVGFAIGYQKKGLLGGIVAFSAFTLPSFLLVIILASASSAFLSHDLFTSITHVLKLLAVVVVFDAILSMYKSFCQNNETVVICLLSAVILLVFPSVYSQLLVILLSAVYGYSNIKTVNPSSNTNEHHLKINPIAYVAFFILIVGFVVTPFLIKLSPEIQLFSQFFQAGGMVFGGGHVVLPLLQNIVSSELTAEQFLTGYAIAQAVPGPMFTLATYLGYFLLPDTPLLGALIATIAIFLPGFLLLIMCLNNWQVLSAKANLTSAIKGVNAAVVGLLISALYQPVFISAVSSGLDMALVLLGCYLLRGLKISVIKLIALFLFTALVKYLLIFM